MIRQWLLASTLAACVIAAGCGSDNSGNSSSDQGNSSSPSGTSVTVSGPFTGTETTLSTDVMGLLEQATAGTPLQGALVCADDAVNHNVLDILNSLVAGLQDPSALSKTTPAQVQSLLQEFAANLGGLLNALGGKGGCGTAGNAPVTNPLAGTPLAPLGAALLPVLQQIQSELQASASSGNTTSLQQLAALVDALNTAFKSGLSQLPSSVTSQPVLGGLLTLLGDTVGNLDATMSAFANNNTSGFQTGVQGLLTVLFDDLLTQVVPLTYLEDKAGKPGVLSTPIKGAVSNLASSVAAALTQGETALQSALSSSQLAPVLNVVNTLLPKIVSPIVAALNGFNGGTLDAALAAVGSALDALLGGSGTSCAFASIPLLSVLCGVL